MSRLAPAVLEVVDWAEVAFRTAVTADDVPVLLAVLVPPSHHPSVHSDVAAPALGHDQSGLATAVTKAVGPWARRWVVCVEEAFPSAVTTDGVLL